MNAVYNTCTFVHVHVFSLTPPSHMIRGKLLGINSNEERLVAIVKHEGTAEHA